MEANSTNLPKEFNQGYTYLDCVDISNHGSSLLDFLSKRYKHSSQEIWRNRIYKEEIRVNNLIQSKNKTVYHKDLISWTREPWEEMSTPGSWETIFDNGDLVVINKPAGLPVMPGGNFLSHTLSELMKYKSRLANETNYPKPVHRLGRFTSGILLCARTKNTRSILSNLIRFKNKSFGNPQRFYRALSHTNNNLMPGKIISINSPICKHFHSKLGYLWAWEDKKAHQEILNKEKAGQCLKAISHIKLLEKRKDEDLLEILIFSGRPHQIRIHLASIGTPLIGDPLYLVNKNISQSALPGEGGYKLHAHRIDNLLINEKLHSFKANLPCDLTLRD